MKKIGSLLMSMLPLSIMAQERGLDERINDAFMPVANWWEALILTSIPIAGLNVPLVVILLVLGALLFTIYFSFPSITRFGLAINVVRGKYDDVEKHGVDRTADVHIADSGDIIGTIRDESQEGEVSHFQALATAVSGTVGLGNIAGVAVAISSWRTRCYLLDDRLWPSGNVHEIC